MSGAEAEELIWPSKGLPKEISLDSLKDFHCSTGSRYKLEKRFTKSEVRYEKEYSYLDLDEILHNYKDFVDDVQKDHRCAEYPPDKDMYDVSGLQTGFGPLRSPDKEEGRITIGSHTYKYAGPRGTLDGKGRLQPFLRVIFTPSKGRWETGLLRWDQESDEQDPHVLGVIVVPLKELDKYLARWGAKRLVIGCEHDCIGAARYHIIQLARHWELETFWMIDDSVPTSAFNELNWGPDEEVLQDNKMGFEEVLKTIESASKNNFSRAALIGPTSTFSTKGMKPDSSRHVTNKRTPTSCVFVVTQNVPSKLNYDLRLLSKEDVMFAAMLIVFGKEVVIDRYIHFKDYPFTEGGCTKKPTKVDAGTPV